MMYIASLPSQVHAIIKLYHLNNFVASFDLIYFLCPLSSMPHCSLEYFIYAKYQMVEISIFIPKLVLLIYRYMNSIIIIRMKWSLLVSSTSYLLFPSAVLYKSSLINGEYCVIRFFPLCLLALSHTL